MSPSADENASRVRELVVQINEGRTVFFFGAGCSMEAPANLPSATALAEDLVGRGFGEPGDDLESIAARLAERSSNALSEALPKADWRARPCNPAHLTLAELAREGLVSNIVTTNWDTLIERALGNSGVPFTPIVNPQLLREGGSAGGVRVAKIHGCIDHPEERLRATVEELREWSAEWVRVLFEYLAQTYVFVFVGYSGAASSVSVTLDAILEANQDAHRSYAIDPYGAGGVPDTETGHAFIAALGGAEARFVSMTAHDFFALLQEELFPLLLGRPHSVCREHVRALCQPTDVNPAELLAVLDQLEAEWRAQGQAWVQAILPVVLPERTDPGHAHQYVPIVPSASLLSSVWLVLTVLLWSGHAELGDSGLLTLARDHQQSSSILVVNAGNERRDVAGLKAVPALVRGGRLVTASLLVFVLGDMGPLPEDQIADVSVVRSSQTRSIVRDTGPMTVWAPATSVLGQLGRDASAEAIRSSVGELVSEMVDRVEV